MQARRLAPSLLPLTAPWVCATLLLGCATAQPERGWVEPRPLAAGIPAVRAPAEAGPGPEASPPDAGPTGDLSLEQALTLALGRSPALRAASRGVRIQDGLAVQAGRIPNPELALTAEDLTGSGGYTEAGLFQLTVELDQPIELGGKRGARQAAAERARDVAGWAYERARIELVQRVRFAFTELLLAQRRLGEAEEEAGLARKAVDAFAAQVEVGRATPLDVNRVRVSLELAELDRDRAGREREAARHALAATWGAERAAFGQALGELAPPASGLPPLEHLFARLEESPELGASRAEVAARQGALGLAEAEAWPDLRVGLGYRYLNDTRDSALLLGLGVPLPLFDRNQGAIEAGRQSVGQAEDERLARRAALAGRLAEAYHRLQAADQEARALGERVLPEAAQAYQSIQEGQALGRFGFLDVLEAQRTLFAVRRRTLEAVAAYQRARIELEGLLGQSLEALPAGR